MRQQIQETTTKNIPKKIHSKIELNDAFQQALELLESGNKHIFITGKAGTGKSTLLDYFRATTKKKIVVLAPTGVAALNVRGQTIHSFFKFKPNVTPSSVKKQRKKNNTLYEKLDAIIIDEISMVRADILDCIDRFMRLHGKDRKLSFGGVQMVFIGDLYQLPPVVTSQEKMAFKLLYPSPYFFDASVFSQIRVELIELEKIYRQKDISFIEILNAIRNNSVETSHLQKLNTRYCSDVPTTAGDDYMICLTTTNARADSINQAKLDELKTRACTLRGVIRGEFNERDLPTGMDLQLKINAQVMFLNNDPSGRWVNGTLGKVIAFDKNEDGGSIIVAETPEEEVVEVAPFTWELFDYSYNAAERSIQSKSIGSFTQYPLRLAWAITIHKSQGKTFDRVILDLDRGTFVHGQLYVALSRCTRLSGLFLKQPIRKSHILTDWHIIRFLTRFQYERSEESMPLAKKIHLLKQAIEEKQKIKITYLKSNDEKSQRIITPRSLGEMEYMEKIFLGLEAYCFTRREVRIFRIDRILKMEIIESE